MGSKSSIEWTQTVSADGSVSPGATWNPVRGCSMANGSETGGCLNCYAARLNARGLPGMVSPTTGEPFARILESGPRWTGRVELIEKALTLPLKWRKPKRIFVNSLSDLFHESLLDEEIDRVFSIMAGCHQHTFQVLTKRPERMLKYLLRFKPDGRGWVTPGGEDAELTHCPVDAARWPLPNIWLGTSIENQTTADMRIPLLLQTPAVKRFVSYEPALGPVDFRKWTDEGLECGTCDWTGVESEDLLREHADSGIRGSSEDSWYACPKCNAECAHLPIDERLDWIIIGGESGPGARPFDIQWARQVIKQCAAAGVACFVKQLGAKPHERRVNGDHVFFDLKDRKGGSMEEWPEDLRVREMPDV